MCTVLVASAIATHGAAQRDVPLETPRREVSFAGKLKAGERFSRLFGPDFLFTLRPEERSSPGPFGGWFIEVTRVGRAQNLADLTIPLRFGARSVYLLAWHFLPNANAPGKERRFAFAPDVGETITEEAIVNGANAPDEPNRPLDLLYSFGRGDLTVRDYALTPGSADFDAGFEWLEFRVTLSWPASYNPRTFTPRPVDNR